MNIASLQYQKFIGQMTQVERNQVMKIVNQILLDLYGPTYEGKYTQPYVHLGSIILLIKSTGVFNPLLVKRLLRKFETKSDERNEIYITKKQLVDQILNPDVQNLKKQDSQDVFNFLRGNSKQIELDYIAKTQQQKSLVSSRKIKKTISYSDIQRILATYLQKRKPY